MRKLSLRKKIIYVFMFVALISSIVLGIFSYINIATSLKDNMEQSTNNMLIQVDNNINILLDSYEDVLYQIYTSDDVITYVDDVSNGENPSVAKNNLRRYLRALVNSKDYIRSITVIASNKEIIAYDQMTNKTYENGWLVNYSLTKDELYDELSQNALLHILNPEYGTTFANEEYYLLHLGHRFIDYKSIQRDVGVVIISIDERAIQKSCVRSENSGDFIFITDYEGKILSCGEYSNYIGTYLDISNIDCYEGFASEQLFMNDFEIYQYKDDKLGWNIVCVGSQEPLISALHKQLNLIIIVEIIVFAFIAVIIFGMTERLARSVDKVVKGMQNAHIGSMDVTVEIDDSMPLEIETIAVGFNEMINKIDEANESERIAMAKQKEAQIAALEAQINPHFLYNTLDTINWIAIDKDEYEISNSISALASILRYAISDSSAIVKLKDEFEWLKKYIYLQQVRLKNKFVCNINADLDVLEAKLHKLLLQPFVENAIVHGFNDVQEEYRLEISAQINNKLIITIKDNGKGMPVDVVNRINSMQILEEDNRKHIGMGNAITRLHMYYGNDGKVSVESTLGEGSTVNIYIPFEK